jgi:hypothetical protein
MIVELLEKIISSTLLFQNIQITFSFCPCVFILIFFFFCKKRLNISMTYTGLILGNQQVDIIFRDEWVFTSTKSARESLLDDSDSLFSGHGSYFPNALIILWINFYYLIFWVIHLMESELCFLPLKGSQFCNDRNFKLLRIIWTCFRLGLVFLSSISF